MAMEFEARGAQDARAAQAGTLPPVGTFGLGSADYPVLLSLIKDAPELLYYRGDLSVLSLPTVAVVGSRRATEYGKWVAYNLGKRCAEHGVVVVSGMAEGIDSYAHQGALAGGGRTVAVFGTGIDICFPVNNGGLLRQILHDGLVLSEYPPGYPASKYTFPQRNRIISGLSYATVVVEAAISSGSLITAERAAEQGREVYAVPGNINRKTSIGCNKLIADGARPLVFLDDVIADLGIRLHASGKKAVRLTGLERAVHDLVLENGEIRPEEAALLTRASESEIRSAVTLLEMKGLVHYAAGRILITR